MRAGEAPFLGSYPYSTLIKTIQVEDHMLRSKYMKITVAVLMASSLQITSAIAEIKPRAAGRVTAKAANTILNGKGAPLTSKGIDGDFYIDTRSLSIYGPKANGKWPAAQSLQGATGTDGKNGNDGKSTTNASSSGAAGAVGPAGPIGLTGLTGPQGDPGTGVGPTGPAGPTGPTGATGAAGSSGSSQAVRGTLSYSDISGSTGNSQLSTITGFKSGKSYSIRIFITTYIPTIPTDALMPIGITLNAGIGTPIISYGYVVDKGRSYRGSGARYEYSAVIDATLDGSASVDFSLAVYVTAGANTSVDPLKIEGTFTAMSVSSVGSF